MAVIKIVPFPGPKGDPGDSTNDVVPLPDFLSYIEGRTALPDLNTNFGWDSNGLWFGPAGIAEGGTDSYPVFSTFNLAETDKVVVTFNVSVEDFCSDMGVCVYPVGTTPQWAWGVNSTRIAAQFNCPNPQIYGIETSNQSDDSADDIQNPGMYQVVFTYDPTAETEKVIFQYFNNNTEVTRLTLNEALPSGNYKIGFASDNNTGDELAQAPYRTYISDLEIDVNNGQTVYSDTLQNGNSGLSADIADFVFTYDSADEESTMTIHNHDMIIRTTRDDNQDADISINSADDLWIDANNTIQFASATDGINFYANANGHQWSFGVNGYTKFPNQSSNQRTGSGEVLKFSDSYNQSIITGPQPDIANPTAQRLVIAGQDGLSVEGFDGEGGDIYLWAGQGAGVNGDGGDIKIDGGYGSENGAGGYVKIRGGDSTNGNGGYVLIEGGNSNSAQSGYVDIRTSNNGYIVLSGNSGEFLNDSSNPDNQIATVGNVAAVTASGVSGSFVSQDGKTITVTNGIITGIEVI